LRCFPRPLSPFRPGIERIIQRSPVTVVPMALYGLLGSWFSRYGKGPLRHRFGHLWQPVSLTVGTPLPPEAVDAEGLQSLVTAMLARAKA
jgi:hypothetical protein